LIHLGSPAGWPKASGRYILSIVESCRRFKIPIRDYLASILPGLAAFPMHRITELGRPPSGNPVIYVIHLYLF